MCPLRTIFCVAFGVAMPPLSALPATPSGQWATIFSDQECVWIGPMADRIYLDFNATMPLRPEARAAMIAAMDVAGNPSSVHAEGRAAKAVVERARAQVAAAFGADGADVVFTSGATEAASLARFGLYSEQMSGTTVEHDCVDAVLDARYPVDTMGQVALPLAAMSGGLPEHTGVGIQAANSETGVLQDVEKLGPQLDGFGVSVLCDAAQAFGKIPFAFNWTGAAASILSAHKIGGPKGVGALVIRRGTELAAQIKGGGQEMGRRSGTENVIGIAGFGAAAEAAMRDLESGIWDHVENLRDVMERDLAVSAKQTIFVGKGARRLPNTSCLATPGWKGETQVMQMDLAGIAISAGSACSSGKVSASRVLRAMGHDEMMASSAIRVSLGPQTTQQEVGRFVGAWLTQHEKFRARAA